MVNAPGLSAHDQQTTQRWLIVKNTFITVVDVPPALRHSRSDPAISTSSLPFIDSEEGFVASGTNDRPSHQEAAVKNILQVPTAVDIVKSIAWRRITRSPVQKCKKI